MHSSQLRRPRWKDSELDRKLRHGYSVGNFESGKSSSKFTQTPITETMLFADRAEHMHKVIRPALSKGEVVICDRYVDSFIAYEKGGRQLDAEEIDRLSHWVTDSLAPDLTEWHCGP